MKRLIFIFIVLFYSATQAQTITIDVTGLNFKEGETVNFIDESLNSVGKGIVKKISEGRSTAIVEVTEGKPSKFMKVEHVDAKTRNWLTQEERDILAIGEISNSAYVWGGLISIWPIGFGTGHAIQGRYRDKGYIFTVGEGIAFAAVLVGFSSCWESAFWERNSCDGFSGSLLGLGVIGFLGFRIWEIIDAWAVPPTHNQRYRELKARAGNTTGFKFDGFTSAGVRFSF